MITDKVVGFIIGTGYDDLPEQATKVVKRCLIDTVGVALAGSREPDATMVRKFCKESGGQPASSIIAGGFKTSPQLAALANGTMAHALDYDDISPGGHTSGGGHPSAVLVPAILSLAEAYKLPGKDILLSFVVGFEVATRVGSAMGLPFYEGNWHTTPVVWVIGAAAAVSRLLRLTAPQAKMALGIVSSLVGGLRENFGTMTKPLHAGCAAGNSVMAGLLASKGFTANPTILENDKGFCATFAGEKCATGKMIEGLGEVWNIRRGVQMKAYPCCGGSHASIDAILELRRRYGFSAEQVAEIECRVSPRVALLTVCHDPRTVQESRFSIEYAVAIALLDGGVTIKQFSEPKVASPLTRQFMSRVKCVYPEELGQGLGLPQEVVVRLTNGKQYSYRVENCKGHPQNPLSDDEVSAKFINCAGLVLETKDAQRALDLIWHLEELKNVTELMRIVRSNSQNGKP